MMKTFDDLFHVKINNRKANCCWLMRIVSLSVISNQSIFASS